jgi:5-formyltetrahydrofolate cyclo-ligase
MSDQIEQQSIVEAKAALRQRMRSLRLVADQKEGPDAALAVVHHVLPKLAELGMTAGTVVAGYWPIATEIDVRPLLARLSERGMVCALPAIVPACDVLLFRRWEPTEALEPAEYGTHQPPASAPEVVPRFVLTPLLAVDRTGHRLGYGRGWYDRTLAALRRQSEITPIGIGYGLQCVDRVPAAADDEPVDYILTERSFERADR